MTTKTTPALPKSAVLMLCELLEIDPADVRQINITALAGGDVAVTFYERDEAGNLIRAEGGYDVKVALRHYPIDHAA